LKSNVPSRLLVSVHRRHFSEIQILKSFSLPHILYKLCTFGGHLSLIKGTLLKQQCAYSVVSPLKWDEFPWEFILGTSRTIGADSARLFAIGESYRTLY